jgi:type I restriction enzyme S subunit
MSAYRPYPKYKDSGVEWVGAIPEGWDVGALKHLVAVPITDGPHETPQFLDEGVPFVSAEAVSSGRIDFSKVRACISPEDNARYSQKYSPKLHDIYMVKSGATTGITAIVENRTDFNIWSPLAAIRCGKKADPHFVLNFMRSRNFLDAITLNWSFGTQQNIGMGVIENLHCTLPPLPEQRQIAAFLDRECGKLDALQAKQERLIELLKEKRQALISHAVTRGLDPTVKLKPSGIEWLGEVPEHWEIEKLWWHFGAEKGKDSQRLTKEFCIDNPGEFPVYSGQTANEGVMGLIDQFDYDEGDRGVLFATTVGAKAMELKHLTKKFSLSQNCMIIRPRHSRFDIRFYLHHFTPLFYFERQMIPDHMQPSFRVEDLLSYRIAIPPLAEQRAIVAHLDEKCGKIDQLKAKAERGIELLKERRSALISAAVTGKIDVRDHLTQSHP